MAAAGPKCRAPRAKIDVFDDRRQKMRALPRAQRLRRPRERALLREQNLRDTCGCRCAQHRADVSRILNIFEQQAQPIRLRQRWCGRSDDGQHADIRRQRGNIGKHAPRDDENIGWRNALHERGNARIVECVFDDDQRLRRPDTIAINADQMLAFEYAAARLAPFARRFDKPHRFSEARILRRADARHRSAARE